MKISNLSDQQFKETVIKMLTKHGRKMEKHSEVFNKETGGKKKKATEVTKLKNIVTELKNTPEGLNSRLDEAAE